MRSSRSQRQSGLFIATRPPTPKIFGDNPPPGFTKVLTFEEVGNQTRLTLVCTFDTEAQKDAVIRRGFVTGTNESFDKLAQHLTTL